MNTTNQTNPSPSPTLPALTPAEVLEEQLSDIMLSRECLSEKRDAVYTAALLAVPCVLRRAADGDLACIACAIALEPHLKVLLSK